MEQEIDKLIDQLIAMKTDPNTKIISLLNEILQIVKNIELMTSFNNRAIIDKQNQDDKCQFIPYGKPFPGSTS